MLTLKFRNVKTILVTQFENFPIKYGQWYSQDPAPLMVNCTEYAARAQENCNCLEEQELEVERARFFRAWAEPELSESSPDEPEPD